jgi:hypothetical protein
MPTVVATVVRRGRAFSGDATACLAGDVGGGRGGGGRDGLWRLFGCRAIMIARARLAFLAWWGLLVGGRHRCLQLMRAVRAARGAWLP